VGESWNPDTGNKPTSEPSYSAASTTAQGSPAYDWSRHNQPSGELKPAAFTPQQILQGAINQFYPGAQFTSLARQAFNNGQYGDAVGYGIGAIADSLLALGGSKLLGAGIASLKGIAGSSWPLRRALMAAGEVPEVGEVAHHIVAKKALLADPARAILERFGIDIHDSANGVFLQSEDHNHLHTTEYYEAVNEALAGAKSRAEVEQILESIRQRTKSGTFP
jgi:hypothetical protein